MMSFAPTDADDLDAEADGVEDDLSPFCDWLVAETGSAEVPDSSLVGDVAEQDVARRTALSPMGSGSFDFIRKPRSLLWMYQQR